VSIGDTLAAARREAGLTITQISQRTCIRETIVRGIERDDYSACGGDFYARGHIRSIAKAVGLDPEPLVHEYDASQGSPQPITAADVFQPFTPVRLKERRRPNWSLVLIAGLVIVLGIAGFKFFGSHHNSPPARQDASSQADHKHKSKAKTVPVAQTVPKDVRLSVITAGSDSWVLVNKVPVTAVPVFEGDVYPGAPKTWTEPSTLTIELGNPAVVTLYINGHKQVLHETQPITLTCTKYSCT
jgi:cytoskeletal protein RodZ